MSFQEVKFLPSRDPEKVFKLEEEATKKKIEEFKSQGYKVLIITEDQLNFFLSKRSTQINIREEYIEELVNQIINEIKEFLPEIGEKLEVMLKQCKDIKNKSEKNFKKILTTLKESGIEINCKIESIKLSFEEKLYETIRFVINKLTSCKEKFYYGGKLDYLAPRVPKREPLYIYAIKDIPRKIKKEINEKVESIEGEIKTAYSTIKDLFDL